MFSQPMYPAENLGYWKARAGKAEDRADDLTAEIERLRAAFIRHRTATHEVKPHFCVTCRESDAVLYGESQT